MAWIKSFTHPDTGAEGNFWEMETILYNHRTQLSELRVSVWVNAAAYSASKAPLHTISYVIPSGLAPQLATGAVQFVSGFAKSQPEFEGWANVA